MGGKNQNDKLKILDTFKKIITNQELKNKLKNNAKLKAKKFSIENTSEKFQKEICSIINN